VAVNERRLPADAWTWDPAARVLRLGVEGRTIRLDVRATCG
jgi:hypothetical protein